MSGAAHGRRVTVAGHPLPAAEADVLKALLLADRPLLVNELVPLLDRGRAHTTVLTLLGRLQERGLVARANEGRAHRYRAAGTEQELAAAALERLLRDVPDPGGALVAFLDRLPPTAREGFLRRLRRRPADADE